MLQCSRANGCPWDTTACSWDTSYAAASQGNLELLEWDRVNGSPLVDDDPATTMEGVCSRAGKHGPIDV